MLKSDGLRTAIVASIGRAFCDPQHIARGITAGALNMRLALGLRDRDLRQDFLAVRAAMAEAERDALVLLDLPATRPRVGAMERKEFHPGKNVWLIDAPEVDPGDPAAVPIPGLAAYTDAVRPGHRVVFRDGRQVFRVNTVNPGRIEAECLLAVEPLQAYNGCCFPDSGVLFRPVSPEDRVRLEELSDAGLRPDWVAVSLVNSPSQLDEVRAVLDGVWPDNEIRIMPKIETGFAADNPREIIGEGDGVLLGRGDLGIALPPERLPQVQAAITREARAQRRPIAVATQILEFFATTGTVNRAELSDIALAVRDGVDALVLCQETSDSRYAIEAIDLLHRVIAVESRDTAS